MNTWPLEERCWEKPKRAGMLMLHITQHPLLGPWGLCHHYTSGIMDKSSLVLSTLHVPMPLVLPDRSRGEPYLALSTTFSVLELKDGDLQMLSHGDISAVERLSANPLPIPWPCGCWLLPFLQPWVSSPFSLYGIQQDLSSNACFLFKLLSCLLP